MSYDAENHLVGVSGAAAESYLYDGDSQLVQSSDAGTTTLRVGEHYELEQTPAEPGPNQVNNPGFEADKTGWGYTTNGVGVWGSTTTQVYEGLKSAKVHATTPGTTTELFQWGRSLTAGTTYRVSFAAKSSQGHDLRVRLLQHTTPFTNLGLDEEVNLTTDWQLFSYEFVASATQSNARLSFFLGAMRGRGKITAWMRWL